MIEIKDEEAIELYNKLKQFILNSKNHEYNDQEDKEVGKVTFINKYKDEITVEIYHRKSDDLYSAAIDKKYLSSITKTYETYTNWMLARGAREVEYSWGLDYEWYYKVTSRELPEDILKPFRKKMHRPKKATNKVYVESLVVDNRTLVDELNEVYNNYYNATKKKELILEEKAAKVKEAIEIVAKEYADSINERMKEIQSIKLQFDSYKDLISKYSTFGIDLIGKTIANIITTVSDKEFRYGNVTNYYDETQFDLMSERYTVRNKEVDSIIVETSKYEEEYNHPEGINKVEGLERDGHAIILAKDKNRPLDEMISFLTITFLTTDEEGKISFNINLDNFEYIKDFIMELVQYRFQRKLYVFTEEDMNAFVNEFIPKAEQIHIKNRIEVLQEELKTLNLKLKK